MFLNPKKCTFAAPEIELLGHIINKEGIEMNPDRVDSIISYPTPRSQLETRAFMGTIQYYHQYIEGFAQITEPIHRLLRKEYEGKNFIWTKEADEAIEILKEIITSEPILARPDFDHPFILQTDACKTR